jgi:hypothetical protein
MGKLTQENLQSVASNAGALRVSDNSDNSESSVILENSDKVSPIKYPRLPCRGCLASCKNYDRCDGKLWRMAN